MPRPPIWIRSIIISLPQNVKVVAVSTTIKPVTQTAEVDVKKAFISESPLWSTVAKLIVSKIVPKTKINKKLKSIVFAGLLTKKSQKDEIFCFEKFFLRKRRIIMANDKIRAKSVNNKLFAG